MGVNPPCARIAGCLARTVVESKPLCKQPEMSEFGATLITKAEQREQAACAQISLNVRMVFREGVFTGNF